jgi:hypothetical protein
MGARNQGGIGLRLHRLAEFIPWNRFLGSINVKNTGSGRKNIYFEGQRARGIENEARG